MQEERSGRGTQLNYRRELREQTSAVPNTQALCFQLRIQASTRKWETTHDAIQIHSSMPLRQRRGPPPSMPLCCAVWSTLQLKALSAPTCVAACRHAPQEAGHDACEAEQGHGGRPSVTQQLVQLVYESVNGGHQLVVPL